MAIAAASLIVVQMITIKHTAELQEKNFSTQVSKALQEVTDILDIFEINQFYAIDADQSEWPSNSTGLFPNSDPVLPLSALEKSGEISVYRKFSSSGTSSVINERSNFFSQVQIQSFQHVYNRKSAQDEQKFRYQIFMKERSEMPLSLRFPPGILAVALDSALKHNDIYLDYKYAILTQIDGKNAYIMGSEDYKPGKRTKPYKRLLLPDDALIKPDYLCIYFPGQNNNFFKSTSFLVFPSLLLTLMIIGIFIVTLQIILRQKKISQIKNDFINNMTHELKTPDFYYLTGVADAARFISFIITINSGSYFRRDF